MVTRAPGPSGPDAMTPPRQPATATVCRGVRGATTLPAGEELSDDLVTDVVGELLDGLLSANGATTEDVAAVVFTVGQDLRSINPAGAARAVGWSTVPLLSVREHAEVELLDVARCVRVLLLLNTVRGQAEMRHLYLRDAAALRPDLADTHRVAPDFALPEASDRMPYARGSQTLLEEP